MPCLWQGHGEDACSQLKYLACIENQMLWQDKVIKVEVNVALSCQHCVLNCYLLWLQVRQTAISADGDIIVSCCDDGTIWRFDLVPKESLSAAAKSKQANGVSKK